MVAIYRGNICINIVDVVAWFGMPWASLQGTQSEYVVCSLIN